MVGKNIKELREKKGVTQRDMASALNVTAQAVSRWEREHASPGIDILPNIAEYFGVSVDYLLRREENWECNNVSDIRTIVREELWCALKAASEFVKK